MRTRTWLAALPLLLLSLGVAAAERILDYHSEIEIGRDAALVVEETIRVQSEGRQIRHGIYRDFPIRYTTPLGVSHRVGFELLSAERDGRTENSRIEQRGNGLRIYLGRADKMLRPGEHEYRIRYRTTRQLGFFDDHDELYWNVTGNGWTFPIDHASARVTLPAPVPDEQLRLAGFTGPQGSTASHLTSRIEDGQHAFFETTRPLAPHEGLTLVLGWPKGLIEPPTETENFVADNRHNLAAVGTVIAVLAYYLLAWWRVGRDPQSGVIAPLYRPPENLSPASMRYLEQMGYDDKAFAAALVNLAVKGALEIRQQGKRFQLERQSGWKGDLAPGEAVLLSTLFAEGPRVELEQENHALLKKALRRHRKRLERDYNRVAFHSNRKYLWPGILLGIGGMGLTLALMPDPAMLASTLASGVLIAILLLLLADLWRKWKKGLRSFKLLPPLLMAGALIYILRDSIGLIGQQQGPPAWPVVASLLVLLLINLGFFEWIKAPTPGGRKLMDRIEGFKLYLSVAEADDILLRGEPKFDADRYQSYLPYALALGVESAWSQRLQQAIETGLIPPDYRPRGLYMEVGDRGFGRAASRFSQQLGSAIASASTAPGSSSGFSGGSSGGGGGGGGGGGW